MFKKKKKKESFNLESYDREYIQEKAGKFLKMKGYVLLKDLGSGSYGDVIGIQKKSNSKIIAAKIMHRNITSPGEIYLWPCLRHPNVLPLLQRMHYKNVDIFLMPMLDNCLYDVLKDPKIRTSLELFQTTTGWLRDIMTGLEYLHEYGVCHLDLTVKNILISSDSKGVICDFSGIAETKQLVNR